MVRNIIIRLLDLKKINEECLGNIFVLTYSCITIFR